MKVYRLTASLLNAYRRYIEAEENWWEYYGDSETPSITLADYMAKAESDLLDALKHRSGESTMAADRGTALNEVVDVAIGFKPHKCVVDRNVATINDRRFVFDENLVQTLMDRYAGALPQMRFSYKFLAKYKTQIELYGYPDYIVGDTIVDLKTTTRYEVGKYRDNMQRYVYPLLMDCCMEVDPESFIFDAVVLNQAKGSEEVTGMLYPEIYPVKQSECLDVVMNYGRGLIDYIDLHINEILAENNNLIRQE